MCTYEWIASIKARMPSLSLTAHIRFYSLHKISTKMNSWSETKATAKKTTRERANKWEGEKICENIFRHGLRNRTLVAADQYLLVCFYVLFFFLLVCMCRNECMYLSTAFCVYVVLPKLISWKNIALKHGNMYPIWEFRNSRTTFMQCKRKSSTFSIKNSIKLP